MKRPLRKIGIAASLLAMSLLVPAIAINAWNRVTPKAAKQLTAQEIRENAVKARGHRSSSADFRMGDSEPSHVRMPQAQAPKYIDTRSASEPRGDFYAVVPMHSSMMSEGQAYLGKINGTTGAMSRLYSGSHYYNGEYEFFTAATRGNYLYIPNSSSSVFDYSVQWYVVDITTGRLVDTVSFGSNSMACPFSMTYDESTDSFFSTGFNETQELGNQICKVTASNMRFELLRDLSRNYAFFAAICYNPADQEVYIFDSENNVYILNKRTGTVDKAGDLDVQTHGVGNFIYEGDRLPMAFSPKDNAFVTLYSDINAQGYRLCYIDADSFEVELGALVKDPTMGCYISSLHNTDLWAEWDAPEMPALPEINFDGQSTSGTITVTASEAQFSGLAYAAGTKLKTIVTLDGQTIFDGELAPGEKKAIEVNGKSGEHTVEVYCQDGSKKSPVSYKVFYIGFDTPNPVTNLKLDGHTLTWNAPKAGGSHGGYVDASVLYYDVYFGQTKQNNRPIQTTSYTITDPYNMAMTGISVVAVSNGMESERTTINEVIGRAKTLPLSIEPTKEDMDIITCYDANGDGNTFAFNTFTDPTFNVISQVVGQFNDPDEWVFLPRIAFPDASKLYQLQLNIGGVYTGTTREDVEIFIGDKANPRNMTHHIWNRDQIPCPHIPNTYTIAFNVPEAGEYFIGIHYKSLKVNKGRGLTLSNFQVTATDRSAEIPAAIAGCKITPKANGDLFADLELTLPTKTLTGATMPADKDITVAVECDGVEEFVSGTGKPGETLTLTVPAFQNGMNYFVVTTGDETGYGLSVAYQGYVGLDIPKAPQNVKLTTQPSNTTIAMSWDKPEAIGLNGSYVDVDNIDYSIYQLTRLSAVDPKRVAQTRNTSYNYQKPASSNQQEFYNLAVAAENAMGYDANIPFTSDILGTPYNLPMVEEYGTTNFDYMPVMRRTGAGYEGGDWKNVGNLSGMSDILCGDPLFNAGGVYYFSEQLIPTKGQIMIPKASTKGITEVIFTASVWDYKDTPNTYITGRTSDDPDKIITIGTIDFEKGKNGKWNDRQFELPEEFCNKDWIQIFINIDFTANENEFFVIDSYSIKQNVPFDLQVSEFGGPETTSVGDNIELYCTVTNSGLESNNGQLDIKLYGSDGTYLDMQSNRIPRIMSGKSGTVYKTFTTRAEWEKYDYILAKAEVVASDDEVDFNNVSEFKIYLKNSPLPAVTDLDAKYNDDHTAVTLTWSEPDLKYGDNEDFEHEPAFELTDKIGLFRNVDLDKRAPFPFEGLTFPNMNEPQGWLVFNADQLGLMGDDRLHPHSGKQYLMARALTYEFGAEDAPRASDWLISPEVVPGSEVSFWYNKISTEYTEYVELWVSTTDDTLGEVRVAGSNGQPDRCGSFYKVRSFSKEGNEAWEKVSFTLPANAKYFALVYCSYDDFGAMIDDIQCTPVELPEWTLDHYSVVRYLADGTIEDVDTNVKSTSALHTTADANASYYVRAFVNTPMGVKYGPLSNQAKVYALGLDDLTDLQGVFGTQGGILVAGHAGEEFALYSADGKYLRNLTLRSDNETIAAAPGIYVVKAGNAMVKVLVK